MGKRKGSLPATTKKIRTLFCSFCKITVADKDVTKAHVRGYIWLRCCPRCGGRLGKYFEGEERHTIRG